MLAHMMEDGGIMGNKNIGEVLGLLQVFEKIEEFGLHRSIQGRRGLVQVEDFWLGEEARGDDGPLALPP